MKGAESPKKQWCMVGRKCLAMRFFRMEVMIVAKTKWPFGGFFLKLLDEKEGTHRYEDYQKELAEHYVRDYGACPLPSFGGAPRYELSGEAAMNIFVTYLK